MEIIYFDRINWSLSDFLYILYNIEETVKGEVYKMKAKIILLLSIFLFIAGCDSKMEILFNSAGAIDVGDFQIIPNYFTGPRFYHASVISF